MSASFNLSICFAYCFDWCLTFNTQVWSGHWHHVSHATHRSPPLLVLPPRLQPFSVTCQLHSFLSSLICTGLFGQLFYSSWSFHDDKGDFQNMVPLMFITVYGIFFLHSILDLLLWLRVSVFKGANYASAATGFLWYAVAYYFRWERQSTS